MACGLPESGAWIRRGAVRQLLGGAVSDVERDQQFIDLALTNISVAAVIALLEQQ